MDNLGCRGQLHGALPSARRALSICDSSMTQPTSLRRFPSPLLTDGHRRRAPVRPAPVLTSLDPLSLPATRASKKLIR